MRLLRSRFDRADRLLRMVGCPRGDLLSGQIVRPQLSAGSNLPPNSQNAQTKLDSSAPGTRDAQVTLDSAAVAGTEGGRDLGSIGPYRLLKRIGEGGMGQVWLAEQTAPVKRRVAVKIIRAGRYDDAALRRFDLERQSLAMMEHPAIAKVFDAGTTENGQPFFVMEHVPGLPITQYCDQKRLTLRQRLELMVQVCEGVQHAHQKAIIHRDLKPSNILVIEVDGKPAPRIIDFGIAKAATQQSDDQTIFTLAGGMLGTPGYVSPEQADSSLDVDTRTDVYSLGVILYELLTGFLPTDPRGWRTKSFHEILYENDPARPSTKIKTDHETSNAIAEKRGTGQQQLVRVLRGDLDWITLKALEKDRGRRYGTPSDLAADIRRYLRYEPVGARPASIGYRLQKYVRRHRVAVTVAASLALLLAGFAVLQAKELRRITRERDRANRITDFMTGMFEVSDPNEARGNTITAREILDKASQDIDTGLSNDPELQAEMMLVMGNVYSHLSLYPKAQPLLERSVDIRRRVLGPRNRDTLTAMEDLAWLLYQEGRYPESEKLESEVLELRRRVLGDEHQDTLRSMRHLTSILPREGRYSEAERLKRQILDIERRVGGPENPATLAAMTGLAATLFDEQKYAEAEKLDRDALAIQRRVLGSDHPETLALMDNLALTLDAAGQYREAESLQRETLDIRRRVLGPEHADTAHSMLDLASVLAHQGQYSEAEKMLQQARDIQRRVLGPDHPDTAITTYELACVAALAGSREQALAFLRESIDHGLDPGAILEIEKEPDLKSLHGDPRFETLVAQAKAGAAPQKKR